jgi:hypothetical protein
MEDHAPKILEHLSFLFDALTLDFVKLATLDLADRAEIDTELVCDLKV